jgi:uncharacterized zinc-type alcohol dehydrogenase-like protein
MVPGHEIVGKISRVGAGVTKFTVGDLAGIGCFVDSCRECASCKEGLEQFCEGGMIGTYNGRDKQGMPTYGGYSSQIVTDEAYTLSIPSSLPLQNVAPLLCAGITTYSPLRHCKVGAGHRVAVLGLGGLGHMAVKFSAAFGADVTMLSTSASKDADAKRLGAHHFVLTSDRAQMKKLAGHFDFILNTVSAPLDLNLYLNLLRRDGTMIIVGAPPKPAEIQGFSLIMKRRSIIGSLIGGIAETQEMLDYCGEKNIVSDVEVIPISAIDTAYDRVLKGDVRYRFVIDMATL